MFFKLVTFAAILLPHVASAKVFLTLEEALKSSFSHCTTKTESIYFDTNQLSEIKKLVHQELSSKTMTRYKAVCDDKKIRYAYTDTHRVRTKLETIFVVVSDKAEIEKIEVLSFDEPEEYIPKKKWYSKFENHKLSPELEIKREIPPVTGASLTARATTLAAQRILGIHLILSKTSDKP